MEAIEDVRQHLRADAGARVGDGDLDLALGLAQRDRNRAAVRGELDGVGQQVPDDLLQARGIAGNEQRRRFEVPAQNETTRRRLMGHRVDGLGHDLADLQTAHVQRQLPFDDPADVEQVGHQLRLETGVARHDVEPALEQLQIAR